MRASSASGGYPIAIRMVKRSSCASGSGYVPSYSIGFWVAMTMNGSGSACVTPSIVTWFSCIDSSSAACVLGDAWLISSTSRRFVKTGPGRNSNSFDRWSNTLTPVTSDGSRSGVNWSRENEQSIDRESALARTVFPTPGKSSMMRWPSATMQITASSRMSRGTWSTRARLSTTRSTIAAVASASAGRRSVARSSIALLQQSLRFVEDLRRDPVLGCLPDSPFATRRQQHDLVVGRVEADVRTGYVVEDEEVRALALELLARPGQTGLARVRREADEHAAVARAAAELGEDVGGRLELHSPLGRILGPFVCPRLRRPVVGDGGGHDHEVGAGGALERFAGERSCGRRLDGLDARRRRNG